MGALLALLLILGIIALGIVWRGYVLSVLWAWFFVPLGLPPVGVAWAIGLAAAISMVSNSRVAMQGEKADTETNMLATFLGPLVVLGVAWVAHVNMT